MDNTSEDSSTGISCVASTSEGSESFPYSRRESSNKYADETENEVETSDISHSSSELAEPPYELIYRNTVDYSDFWADNSNMMKRSAGPQEILLRVFLPGVKSADEIELDVCDYDILLTVVGKYFLKVALSFPVDESKSVAKFDKNKMKLELTLPTCMSTRASGKGPPSSCAAPSSSSRSSDKLSDDGSDS